MTAPITTRTELRAVERHADLTGVYGRRATDHGVYPGPRLWARAEEWLGALGMLLVGVIAGANVYAVAWCLTHLDVIARGLYGLLQ